MSNSNEESSAMTYVCQNCSTRNTSRTRCVQCQAEFIEDSETRQENDQQQIPLVNQFQNLFTDDFDPQSFTNTLLPMLIQPSHQQFRSRRKRPSRRIKRIARPFRYLPPLNLPPVQVRHNPTASIPIPRINEFIPGQVLTAQYQSNVPLIQIPLQLFIFDPNMENLGTRIFREDNQLRPLSQENIDQLPFLTMTTSSLTVNPVCSICLENFDLLMQVKQLPICHHIFHRNCLTEWLLQHSTCPMCRVGVLSNRSTSLSVTSNYWMEQFFVDTLEQQPRNTIVPNSPVKTIDLPQISLETVVPNEQTLSNTLQLPRFDSSTNRE
ncbi:unnamed protein product [Adineta ricciae]|uniref:RING-type domain-containing protein n=1 Tax=Adineta ricciae TaxID=249248 RepID=A0A815MFW2_ADIRI|nr:unnamed protein product [Adineta ricciae]